MLEDELKEYNKSTEFKPCPFCADNLIFITLSEQDYQLRVETRYQIGCNTVGCFGCRPYSRKFKTKEKATEAWNRRDNKPIWK